MQHPHLWWPNGYGEPELYHLEVEFLRRRQRSRTERQLRFGIREITYELSLLDSTGHLRRLEYSPDGGGCKEQQVVNVSRNGMREIPAADPFPPNFPPEWKEGWKSWVLAGAGR